MEKSLLTLEHLPEAVQKLHDRFDRIERLILKRNEPIQSNASDLVTIQEAADLLHLSVPTCYTKVSKRELPHTKKGGRLYFSRQELLKWLQQGRRKTNAELEQEENDYLALKKKK